MKTKYIVLAVIILLIASTTGWWILKNLPSGVTHQDHADTYYCPMHPDYTSKKSGTCPICNMNLVKRPPTLSSKEQSIYYCPMHPDYTSPKPGTCPICNMNLVKKEKPNVPSKASEHQPKGYAPVSMDVYKQQLIGIKTTPVVKKSLVKTIHAFGYVVHDLELYEAEVEYINAWREYYAYLSRRSVRAEYYQDWRQYYTDSPSVIRWRSDKKLLAQERLFKIEYQLRHLGLSDADLEELRKIPYGQPWIQPDLLFFEKDQPYWIYAQIFESDLGFVAAGQKAIATIPAYRKTTEGIVRFVAPYIDPVTRTARVRIEMPQYKGELSVNMFVNVDLPVELDESLLIPREAVMDTGLQKIVFVEKDPGFFEPRTIQTGFEGDGTVVVTSGLKEGETVVVGGNFLLDSESRLQSAFSSSASDGGHNHGQ